MKTIQYATTIQDRPRKISSLEQIIDFQCKLHQVLQILWTLCSDLRIYKEFFYHHLPDQSAIILSQTYYVDQVWGNFLTYGTHWNLKFDGWHNWKLMYCSCKLSLIRCEKRIVFNTLTAVV